MSKQWILAVIALLAGSIGLKAQTQRIGFVNIKKVYDTLPAKDSAAKNYQVYEKFYADRLKAIEEEAAKLDADIKSYTATPGANPEIKSLKEQQLLKLQNDYYETQKMAEETLASKQNMLIAPIIEEIKVASGIVAKQKGYTQVVDNSAGILLYNGVAADDLTEADVKYMLAPKPAGGAGTPKK